MLTEQCHSVLSAIYASHHCVLKIFSGGNYFLLLPILWMRKMEVKNYAAGHWAVSEEARIQTLATGFKAWRPLHYTPPWTSTSLAVGAILVPALPWCPCVDFGQIHLLISKHRTGTMDSKATSSGLATWVTPLQLNHSWAVTLDNLSSLLYTRMSTFALLLIYPFKLFSSCHPLLSPKSWPWFRNQFWMMHLKKPFFPFTSMRIQIIWGKEWNVLPGQ